MRTPVDFRNLLDSYDTWLFDCDGVLWNDDQMIDGVIEVLGILRRQGEYHNPYTIAIERREYKARRSSSSRITPQSPGRLTKLNSTS